MACVPFRTLVLTDGTTDDAGIRREVDLLNEFSGFCLVSWAPAITAPKGGGVWADSALASGRRLKLARMENVIETFTLEVRNFNADALIKNTQELRRLLEKARTYWTTDWQSEKVWLEAVGIGETNMRYSLVMDWRTPQDGDPYAQPFWQTVARAGMDDFDLVVEREPFWSADEPGTGTCVEISAVEDYCSTTPLEFDGIDDEVNCGSPAGLDNLPDNAVSGKGPVTIDGWIRADGYGEGNVGRICDKSSFRFQVLPVTGLRGVIFCAAQQADSWSGLDEFSPDGLWHHATMTYSETGAGTPAARTVYLAIDGTWVTSYPTQQVSIGNYTLDGAVDLIIGDRVASDSCFDGAIGWLRVSDNIRFTPNVDFTAPARCPLPLTDANTQGLYVYEGEGGTTGNVGAAGGVGMITGATWSDDCCSVYYGNYTQCSPSFMVFNADTSDCNCGSDPVIDDLPAGQYTAEVWIRADSYGEANSGKILYKANVTLTGWYLTVDPTHGLIATIYCATTWALAYAGTDDFSADGLWHHIAVTFDGTLLPAGNPVIRMWVDGAEISYSTQQAGVGNYVVDAALNLHIGNRLDGANCFDGGIGWSRLSDNMRYTADFTPPDRCTVPAPDANTVATWNAIDPATAYNFAFTAADDGTLTDVIVDCDCTTTGRDPTCEEG